MRDDLTALMLNLAGVAALVENRVHWRRQPADQDAKPYLNLSQVGENEDVDSDGRTGLVTTRVQFDAWADNVDAAWRVARALREGLNGYRGTIGGTLFQGVFMAGGGGDLNDDQAGADVFGVSTDFLIVWSEIE